MPLMQMALLKGFNNSRSDSVFFQKPCMKVAELGIYLGQWMEQVQHGQKEQLNYETSDRESNSRIRI